MPQVVIGARKRPAIAGRLHGTVAPDVLDRAAADVLVVREPGGEGAPRSI